MDKVIVCQEEEAAESRKRKAGEMKADTEAEDFQVQCQVNCTDLYPKERGIQGGGWWGANPQTPLSISRTNLDAPAEYIYPATNIYLKDDLDFYIVGAYFEVKYIGSIVLIKMYFAGLVKCITLIEN